MGSRLCVGLVIVGACATAGQSTDDQGLGGDGGTGSAMIDAPPLPPDACGDDDSDGVCNIVDKCAGHPDNVDTDADTIADGCDRCPGVDDRVDINTNSVPDCAETQMRTIDLKSVSGNRWRGWYANNSAHATGNDNTLTGAYLGGTYNSYYVFPLSGFSASVITSVTLELQLELYTADATETISVWDVTTPAATVENGTTDATIFTDLQAGNQYATATISNAQLNQIVAIPLNARAAMDATGKLNNDFVIGVHLDTAPGYVRFGDTSGGQGNENATNRITIKYLP
ncbi:MAG: hypothetical protein HOV81_29240 [Kofleriaceae bacterium]|nr:hypothetical protein [Kofleriaceae bacterium]